MRIPRVFLNSGLNASATIALDARAHHHLINVLRLTTDNPITVFNGKGGEYDATLTNVSRKSSSAQLHHFHDIDRESHFRIRLLQGISRNEHMDHTLQKAVELGVHSIVPVITERTPGRLSGERLEKKLYHWHGIIISACEQCGRNRIPVLHQPVALPDIPRLDDTTNGIVLAPGANTSLREIRPNTDAEFSVLIGSEGGLTDGEIDRATEKNFVSVSLGERILRTETAGLAIIAIAQSQWGDLG